MFAGSALQRKPGLSVSCLRGGLFEEAKAKTPGFCFPKLRLPKEFMPAAEKELKLGGLEGRVTGTRVEREVSNDDREGGGHTIAIGSGHQQGHLEK